MNHYEDIIRDNLALNLSMFNMGLVLIDKEHYLPKSLTTKSFIDILAKDNDSNYVIIEVKRSKQSEREAIHEIYKYTEAIKDKYKLSPGEVKSIIVSTEWEELFIPFSSFVNESKNTVFGFKLIVDSAYKPVSITKVNLCKTNKGRLFSSVQDCNYYSNEENLKLGIQSHLDVFKRKNIDDYVLIILKAPPFDRAKYIENLKGIIGNISEQLFGDDDHDFPERFDEMVDEYQFIIYSAFQRLTKDEYYRILSKDPVSYQETKSYVEENLVDEDEIITHLESSILNTLKPQVYSDNGEIGYPSKFTKFISGDEPWQVREIKRSKGLAGNILLTDEKIISEIQGDTGLNFVTFSDDCSLAHKAKYAEIKEKVFKTLKYNITWQNDIKAFFEKIDTLEIGELSVFIFSPNNILLTLIRMATENHSDWMPKYVIRVITDEVSQYYLGTIDWNKKNPNLHEIVTKYFQNKPENILAPMMWVGEYDENNLNIFEDLGLSYQSDLMEENSSGKMFFRYSNYKFNKTERSKTEIIEFIVRSPEFISELVQIYNTHYYNGFITL